jgi:large subunit ribosomal protein L25
MLEGIVRDSITKPAVKALRKDGYLIANIYGKGMENISAAFKRNEYIKYLKSFKKRWIFNCKYLWKRYGEHICSI